MAEPPDPWTAIPDRAAVIIEVPDALSTWDRFVHTSQFWGSLEMLPGAAALNKLMTRAMEEAENTPSFREAFDKVGIVLSAQRAGGGNVELLFAFVPRSTHIDAAQVARVLGAEATALSNAMEGRMVELRPDSSWPVLSLVVDRGIWLIANSSSLLEEAMRSSGRAAQTTDEPLMAARSTLGAGSDAHILVHGQRGRGLLHAWWTPATVDAIALPDGWAALDLRSRPDAMLLSGLFLPATPDVGLITIDEQGTGRTDLARWMPGTVTHWDVRHISNAEQYLLRRTSEAVRNELAPGLFNWVSGSTGIASIIDSSGGEKTRLAFFQAGDQEEAAAALGTLCPDRTCDTSEHRGTRMTRLPLEGALERLLGADHAGLPQPWWCMLGDVVVMAPGTSELAQVIDAWNDGRTLAEDARTTRWSERIASHAGRTIRWDIARHAPALRHGSKPGTQEQWKDRTSLLEHLGGASIQLSPAQHGYTHISIGLEHAPLQEVHHGVHWSLDLEHPVMRRPDIVRNHVNGTSEVLVQDVAHTLHLVGPSGRKLWSLSLEGPILGEVHQIDRFKNGKLQLLFNTVDRIHLIDRNGKEVDGYPITLKPGASAPLAVFDYDGQRDHRILVPLADGSVRNYSADTRPVEGWAPPVLDAPMSNCVHHVRVGNMDRLLLVGGDGELVLLDRRGNRRETAGEKLGKGAIVHAVRTGNDIPGTRIIWSTPKGGTMVTTLQGGSTELTGGRTWGSRLLDRADQAQEAVIAWRGDSLALMQGGAYIFSRSLGDSIAGEPSVHDLGNAGQLVGVVLKGRRQVSLLDEAGRDMDGMPQAGTTALRIADLDLDGLLEFITITDGGQLVAYHLPAVHRRTP